MIAPARRLARLLTAHNLKVVFAESCTGGLVSGALTQIAGISEHHCGGMVVYRNETKQQYLGIPRKLLDEHGAVSERVAREMATRILKATPEADYAASVTGHLGPNAPPKQDGLVFIGVAHRTKPAADPSVYSLRCSPAESRTQRQKYIVIAVLLHLARVIEADVDAHPRSHAKRK